MSPSSISFTQPPRFPINMAPKSQYRTRVRPPSALLLPLLHNLPKRLSTPWCSRCTLALAQRHLLAISPGSLTFSADQEGWKAGAAAAGAGGADKKKKKKGGGGEGVAQQQPPQQVEGAVAKEDDPEKAAKKARKSFFSRAFHHLMPSCALQHLSFSPSSSLLR